MVRILRLFLATSIISSGTVQVAAPASAPIEITTAMVIDVDGAPNAYGPKGKPTLDFELNAHKRAQVSGEIVGYLTKDDGKTPELQGPSDPFPGYYISTTAFFDRANPNPLDPKRYVDATKINYVVMSDIAMKKGVALGDFVAVYSTKSRKSVYGIVGDDGNPSGAEGSLALLQALGYPFRNGKSGSVEGKELVVRYFPGSNPKHMFYQMQAQIDAHATAIGLNKQFPLSE